MTDSTTPSVGVPPFDPRRFARRLALDSTIRGVILALTLGAGLWILLYHSDESRPLMVGGMAIDPIMAIIALLLPWIAINVIGARMIHESRRAAEHIEQHELAEGEALLLTAGRRWPVSMRARAVWLRHLAQLRHHQSRHGEAMVICRQLLALGRRSEGSAYGRAELLLRLVESALECRSLVDAYQGLTMLHALPLRLEQRLAQMLMQTHYEVLLGADAWALHAWRRKAELSELMPQPLCGVVHAFLAAAAHRAEHADAAAWLTARAKLLAPRQLRYVFHLAGVPQGAARLSET